MPSYRLFDTRTQDASGVATDGVATPAGAQDFYSKKMRVSPAGDIGFQLIWTGVPTGVFTLWYSDVEQPNEANDNDWVPDTSWVPTNPAGAASKGKYVISGIRTKWVRIKYAHTGGVGVMSGKGTW